MNSGSEVNIQGDPDPDIDIQRDPDANPDGDIQSDSYPYFNNQTQQHITGSQDSYPDQAPVIG